MIRTLILTALFVILASPAASQQQNTPSGSMWLDECWTAPTYGCAFVGSGAPYPIYHPVSGTNGWITPVIGGQGAYAFEIWAAAGLPISGNISTPIGSVDLDPSTAVRAVCGSLIDPCLTTVGCSSLAPWMFSIAIPYVAPILLTTMQTIVFDPAAPTGAVLTGAVGVG